MPKRPPTALLALVLMPLLAGSAQAQETAAFFKKNCSSCHTIGGGQLTGPDLKGVTKRAERPWLLAFVQNPQGAIDRGDAYALKLQREARGVVMPRVDGMSPDRATALLDLIDAESALEKSQFQGAPVSDRPLTAADEDEGRALFTGTTTLKAGGPACMGCHSVGSLSGLGGGHLGPDLTDVFGRLEGRKALSAWLSAPATPTMGKVFGAHPLDSSEILPVVAFLKAAGEHHEPGARADGVNFLVLGLAGVACALVGVDLVWKRRFRAVRSPLVLGGRP